MMLRIFHETKLTYSEPVVETVTELRTAPPSQEDQTVLGYRLKITPSVAVTPFRDGFGNQVDLFNILGAHQEIIIRAISFVRMHRRPGLQRLANVSWPGELPVAVEAQEFLTESPLTMECPPLVEFREKLPKPEGTFSDLIQSWMAAIRERLTYEKKLVNLQKPISEALATGKGNCQDFAHFFLAICRHFGVPARFVSGYINHPGELATHAWCQVWGGSRVGWVDVDPTRSCFVGNDHVVTAIGRDYADMPPNRGQWKGTAEETMRVTVKVEPVERMPSDWTELNSQVIWSGPKMFQVQRQGQWLNRLSTNRTILRQQQSQQQQHSQQQQ
jgi:transglutaminase-like putative cysteine protease